jgi:hypothetical protein
MESKWATIYSHPEDPVSIKNSRVGMNRDLRIGTGKRCRRTRLNADGLRRVANALFSSAQKLDEELDKLKLKAKRSH